MKLTIIESPYKGKDYKELDENIKYAKECLLDCLKRGEAPLISHLLYTQVLEDKIPEERKLGIEAGLAWGDKADLTAVYTDKGISKGMEYGIERARERGRKIVYRKLN